MVIRKEHHTLNGKFVGVWYHFPDGRIMYLVHYSGLKTKGCVFKKNAWYMETAVLREAERRGCTAVGVVHRVGKHKYLYLTNREDFWKVPSEVGFYKSMSQRIMPKMAFRVNPSDSLASIDEHVHIR